MSFKHRSYQKELLDGPNISFEDIKRNLQELDFINQKLGGHAITLKGVAKTISQCKESDLHIVEIGCGGGDNLRMIQQWARKKKKQVTLTGIDINEECIAFAKQQACNDGISFVCSDYRTAVLSQPVHLIFSSLFCHHFTNEELVEQLQWLQQHCRIGFFINDLHRHPLAYFFIKWLTHFFSKSYLVKNDAPLSVKRGFRKSDWQLLLQQAGITRYSCQWQWAFRWLVLVPR